jgi:two-component system chemotaxis response regulator CheB
VIAEDSPTVRQLLIEVLRSDPAITVIGEATNGLEAVELAARLKPDLIAMDIHMPQMDGLEATREIMTRTPTPIVLVTSSASRADNWLSFDALRAGALAVVSKPDNPESARFTGRSEQLLRTLKAMADVKVVRRWAERPAAVRGQWTPPATRITPRIVAMAASTGGPAALHRILSALPANFGVPVLIVQHIATGFVDALADWLGGASRLKVRVAHNGEALTPGTVYIAPDDHHLGVSAGLTALSDAPPIGGHRPSATHLFDSVAKSFGAASIALILTGMGKDGVAGLGAVREAGGQVIAQDEKSSVVFGMPGEAAAAGVTSEVLSLDDIATRLMTLAGWRA